MSEVIPTTSETENPDKLLRASIHDLAERYWKIAPYKKSGIARFAEPLDLASELGSELEDLFCEDFPWGLKPTRLVSLGWSGWGPGTGFDWRLFSLPLKTGRRIYV
ncbi:MAG: hypothetical protein FJZ01_28080, partial [Candidatus Sericytochromatia bacterium]|nr:hypothetical protein [Candidatus Tanganyikabacteria bacterium]